MRSPVPILQAENAWNNVQRDEVLIRVSDCIGLLDLATKIAVKTCQSAWSLYQVAVRFVNI